jgi:hypothetical protein
MNGQTEAQRLADELVALHGYPLSIKAADELRRLDAELERKSEAIQRLWAERDSLRASMEQLLKALESDKQLLQQALDALIRCATDIDAHWECRSIDQIDAAGVTPPIITALRDRLAHCDRCGKKLGGEGDIHTCTPKADPIGDAQDRLIAEMAAQPEQEPVQPVAGSDKVICPACCQQFRAIPESAQRLMLDAGFEPPFTTPPAAQPSPVQEPVGEVVEDDFSRQLVGIGKWRLLPNGAKLYTTPPAAPVHVPSQREFENWLRSKWTAGYACPKLDGRYTNAAAQSFWECWQAAHGITAAPEKGN